MYVYMIIYMCVIFADTGSIDISGTLAALNAHIEVGTGTIDMGSTVIYVQNVLDIVNRGNGSTNMFQTFQYASNITRVTHAQDADLNIAGCTFNALEAYVEAGTVVVEDTLFGASNASSLIPYKTPSAFVFPFLYIEAGTGDVMLARVGASVCDSGYTNGSFADHFTVSVTAGSGDISCDLSLGGFIGPYALSSKGGYVAVDMGGQAAPASGTIGPVQGKHNNGLELVSTGTGNVTLSVPYPGVTADENNSRTAFMALMQRKLAQ
jgi:hypothetical protein